eukprot:ctg_1834.g470
MSRGPSFSLSRPTGCWQRGIEDGVRGGVGDDTGVATSATVAAVSGRVDSDGVGGYRGAVPGGGTGGAGVARACGGGAATAARLYRRASVDPASTDVTGEAVCVGVLDESLVAHRAGLLGARRLVAPGRDGRHCIRRFGADSTAVGARAGIRRAIPGIARMVWRCCGHGTAGGAARAAQRLAGGGARAARLRLGGDGQHRRDGAFGGRHDAFCSA